MLGIVFCRPQCLSNQPYLLGTANHHVTSKLTSTTSHDCSFLKRLTPNLSKFRVNCFLLCLMSPARDTEARAPPPIFSSRCKNALFRKCLFIFPKTTSLIRLQAQCLSRSRTSLLVIPISGTFSSCVSHIHQMPSALKVSCPQVKMLPTALYGPMLGLVIEPARFLGQFGQVRLPNYS